MSPSKALEKSIFDQDLSCLSFDKLYKDQTERRHNGKKQGVTLKHADHDAASATRYALYF